MKRPRQIEMYMALGVYIGKCPLARHKKLHGPILHSRGTVLKGRTLYYVGC